MRADSITGYRAGYGKVNGRNGGFGYSEKSKLECCLAKCYWLERLLFILIRNKQESTFFMKSSKISSMLLIELNERT